MSDAIEQGDTVNVYFTSSSSEFRVTVKYVPCATGDCWRLERRNGTPLNAMQFEKMEKVIED